MMDSLLVSRQIKQTTLIITVMYGVKRTKRQPPPPETADFYHFQYNTSLILEFDKISND